MTIASTKYVSIHFHQYYIEYALLIWHLLPKIDISHFSVCLYSLWTRYRHIFIKCITSTLSATNIKISLNVCVVRC